MLFGFFALFFTAAVCSDSGFFDESRVLELPLTLDRFGDVVKVIGKLEVLKHGDEEGVIGECLGELQECTIVSRIGARFEEMTTRPIDMEYKVKRVRIKTFDLTNKIRYWKETKRINRRVMNE